MIDVAIYDDATGTITGTLSGSPAALGVTTNWIEVTNIVGFNPHDWSVVDGALVQNSTIFEKSNAIFHINNISGAVRRKYVTDIAGQELIYMKKEIEAIAYLTESPEPTDLSAYPFLSKEVGTTAPTAHDVAQVYINLATQWTVVGSLLEEIRLDAIVAVEAATTGAEINAALESFDQSIAPF